MSGFYIGVDGKARKIKGGYIGIDGKARKIKKGYIGVDGVARLCWSDVDPVFANNSWEEIAVACQNGNVPDSWAVGDQKTMTIGGNDYTIDIIGKNHDDYADGSGKAPLTFQLHECYKTNYPMHTSGTNNGGWLNCAMRNTYLPSILKLMPTEIQNAIREITKKTSIGNNSSTISTTAEKLFLLSEVELFGKNTYSKNGEGEQYPYYVNNTKVKSTSTPWLLRSPDNTTYGYCAVYTSGVVSTWTADSSGGVSFAFCF